MWSAYKSTERPVPCARLRCRNAPTQNVRFEREGGRGGGGSGGEVVVVVGGGGELSG